MEEITPEDAKYYADRPTLEKFKGKIFTKKDLQILNISQESYDRWINEEKTNLKKVYEVYKKYFNIDNCDRIDIVLATALSNKLGGIPIWLILVGASGDMKSVQLNSLIGLQNVFVLHNLTSKTLVNGYKDKDKFPDLAPELNKSIVIIPDMAQILKLPPIEKGELWGQLRDLYDGLAGKVSGMGGRARYQDLKVTLIAGSTPAIDGQILVHQDLGTRELIYRTHGNIKKKDVMKRCFDNEEFESEIMSKIKKVTKDFLEEANLERIILSPESERILMDIAIYITYMRATAEVDQYSNELRNDVYPEEPTRIAKQIKRLYLCLKSLDKNYPDEKAFRILWHIGKSSAFPLRIKIFNYLLNHSNEEISLSALSDKLLIGKSTAKRELNVLWNMKLVDCRREIISAQNPDRTYDYWKLNKNGEFIQEMLKNRPSI